jgi:hypothetical protein
MARTDKGKDKGKETKGKNVVEMEKKKKATKPVEPEVEDEDKDEEEDGFEPEDDEEEDGFEPEDDEEEEDLDVDEDEEDEDEDSDDDEEDEDEDEEEEDTPPPSKKKGSKTPPPPPPAKKKGGATGNALRQEIPDGHLSLADVAAKVKVTPKYLRQLIRTRFLPSWKKGAKTNGGNRYHWAKNDPQLQELLKYFSSGQHAKDVAAKKAKVAEARENFAKMARERSAAKKAGSGQDLIEEVNKSASKGKTEASKDKKGQAKGKKK